MRRQKKNFKVWDLKVSENHLFSTGTQGEKMQERCAQPNQVEVVFLVGFE